MKYTEILINIRKILRAINLESKRIEKEHGISIPQYLCLNYLSECEEYRAKSSDIKHYLQLNASTVTGLIDRLENKNLVARLPNVKDKRSTLISLTTQGAKIVEEIPSLLHEKLTTKLNQESSKEIEEISHAIGILVKFMEIEDMDASPLIAPDSIIQPTSK